MIRSVALGLAILACSLAARGQEPTITYPAGTYSITTPAATTIERGDGYVTFRWAVTPAPTPTPVPPAPTPADAPPPVITGHAWAMVIHDASHPLSDAQKSAVDSLSAASIGLDIALSSESAASGVGKSWAENAAFKSPLPALVVVQNGADGKATIVHQQSAPKDAAGLMPILKKLRGRP